MAGLRSLYCGVGRVVEISGCIAECTHPLEKSATDFRMQAYISYLPGSIFSEVNFRFHDFCEVRGISLPLSPGPIRRDFLCKDWEGLRFCVDISPISQKGFEKSSKKAVCPLKIHREFIGLCEDAGKGTQSLRCEKG